VALELVLRAREALSRARPDEAEALAREAARDTAHAAEALHILGLAHLRRGRAAEAEEALRKAIARDSRVAGFHSDLGNALQDAGKLDEAIRSYRRALRLQPELAEAWNDLGTALYAKGQHEGAIECYRRALALRPDHTVAYANLGAVYRKVGLLSEARRALQKELWLRLRQKLGALGRRTPDLARLAQEQLALGNARHAAEIAARALEHDARDVEALLAASAAALRLGKNQEAAQLASAAAAAGPADARGHVQLGLALAVAGRRDEAAAAYEAALRLRPDSVEALSRLADLRLRAGDPAAAEALIRRALARAPAQAKLHVLLGEARHRQQALAQAEAHYREALALEFNHLPAYIRLSDVQRELSRFEEAIAAAKSAIEIDEESALAHVSLGLAQKARGRTAEAAAAFRRALELDPRSVQAMQQLALALREDDRMREAEEQLRAALKLRPKDPGLLSDLAIVLSDTLRYAEALDCVDRALALDPKCLPAINRKAVLKDLLGQYEESLALLEQAQALAPQDSHVRYNIGLLHLKYGRFAAGWEGYEERRRFETFTGRHRHVPLPEWDGAPLAGRVLLVLPEQGLGDEIMFASCIPELARRARHVVLECDPKLEALFRRSFPACSVVSRLRTFANDWVTRLEPRPDLQVAAGSLARHFRGSLEQFPEHRGFLAADPASIEKWRQRLDALGPGRKIGLSWQGGVGFTGKRRRSLTLEQLLPVLRLPGTHFISLQYTDVQEELRALESRHSVRVHHWKEAIDDYDQTAALVRALDGVLTVCTAIVHLSGGLGQRALVMVPFGADWRYGASGERMPWYSSVRLVRQRRIEHWDDVLHEVAQRIAAERWD
jgi:tetratricopeptide (TPR) repeat protein